MGAKIAHALQPKKPKNIKKKQYCSKLNKDFKKKWSILKKQKQKQTLKNTHDLKNWANFSGEAVAGRDTPSKPERGLLSDTQK